MNSSDKSGFAQAITEALAFWRQDVTTFTLSVWWEACKPFSMEQVSKALTAHALDPERGQFAPKPADVVRVLRGTNTDRSLMAWSKVHSAMARVGGYQSIAFDDAAIHSVIEDLGGWPRVCQTPEAELQFLQKRFCDAHKAYAARGNSSGHPRYLVGMSEQQNGTRGFKSPGPVLIGDPDEARRVIETGNPDRVQITHIGGHVQGLLDSQLSAIEGPRH